MKNQQQTVTATQGFNRQFNVLSEEIDHIQKKNAYLRNFSVIMLLQLFLLSIFFTIPWFH